MVDLTRAMGYGSIIDRPKSAIAVPTTGCSTIHPTMKTASRKTLVFVVFLF